MNVVKRTIWWKIVVTKNLTIPIMTSKSHHTYKNQKTQGVENSIEQSLQSLTNLVKTLIKQNSQPHSSYQKPTFRSNNNKYQNNQNKPHNRDRNRGYNNKGKYRNNTRINELGEYQSDNSSCSDQSEGEDEFWSTWISHLRWVKKLGYPSQENDSLLDPLRGNNLISYNSRQHPSSTNDDVHSPMNTHQPSVNSPMNNNLEVTQGVKSPTFSYFFTFLLLFPTFDWNSYFLGFLQVLRYMQGIKCPTFSHFLLRFSTFDWNSYFFLLFRISAGFKVYAI